MLLLLAFVLLFTFSIHMLTYVHFSKKSNSFGMNHIAILFDDFLNHQKQSILQ